MSKKTKAPKLDAQALGLEDLNFPCDTGRVTGSTGVECPNHARWSAEVHQCDSETVPVLLCDDCVNAWDSVVKQSAPYFRMMVPVRCVYCGHYYSGPEEIIKNVRRI